MSRLVPFAALVLTLLGSPVAAQQLREEARAGSDFLRHLVGRLNLTPLANFAEADADPTSTVIVSLGDPAWLSRHDVVDFVNRGGALLVASDRAYTWTSRQETFSIEDTPIICFEGSRVYDSKPELPLLEPPPEHLAAPVTLGARVVVSLPSRLRVPRLFQRGGIVPLAFLPEQSVRQRDTLPLPNPYDRVFAVGGPSGTGKVILLADAHVFMNDLMARTDLNNYEFAAEVLGYLRIDTPARTRCLFVDSGRFVGTLPESLDGLFETAWEALRRQMALIEARIGAAEQEGKFHEAFWNLLAQRNFSPARVAVIVTVGLTLLGGVYLLYRLIQARVANESRLPRLATSVEAQVPTVRLQPARVEEQLKQGRLYEPARHLARAMFLQAGCSASPTPPKVRVAGSWWQRRRMTARFRRLWSLAFGSRPVSVRLTQWPGLVRDVQSLRQAFVDGAIQMESVQAA